MCESAELALRRHFGYDRFRPGQGAAIRSVLGRRDTLVVMPTGGGKSICYQVPALVLPGLTLVISPLIALMLDQVSALQARGVPAALVNSTLTSEEIRDRLAAAVDGRIKLLYVAPERFESATFRRAVGDMDVAMVAVDEAHCVCEWGHDFRPSYLKLREVWPLMGRPPILALTATATPEVRGDIVKELRLENARVIVRGFDRPNLRWTVRREEKLSEKARTLIRVFDGNHAPAIVYASTRKMVESVTETLRCAGVRAAAYHAGLPQDVRPRVQEAWMEGDVPVVVATNAFGMGVDKADVRRVIHFQMPGSLEAYYQEAGRAGRDGLPADCVLLHSYRDRFTHEFFIRASHPPRKVVIATYRALQAAAPPGGGPIPATRFIHRVPGIKSAREVYSALRLLRDAGAVENASGGARCTVRWIASRVEVESLIANGDASRAPLLRSLLRATASGPCFQVSLRDLARRTDSDFTTVRSALEGLQKAGVLGWREESGRSGYAPTRPQMSPDALPVDWDRARRRRDLELRKLKRMERYAYQRACRRRYILRYFGEDAGWRCRSCDRCLPEG